MRSKHRAWWGVVAVVGAVLPWAAGAYAQSYQGGIRGAVKDAQGVIPGAIVTLTNDGTGVIRDTVTNDSGGYSFPALDAGTVGACLAAAAAGAHMLRTHDVSLLRPALAVYTEIGRARSR